MELAHSLLLNEQALNQIPEHKRPVFIFEWLRFLDGILPATQKADVKGCQQRLVEQLFNQVQAGPGPPIRKLLGRCMATLFSVGDTFSLFQAINTCNDILKNRDDSAASVATKLCALSCLGSMYEKLGRMVGRSFEETTQVIVKALKNAESQMRIEIMITMEKMVCGLGTAGNPVYKELYKAAKYGLTDRVLAVRSAAAGCIGALIKEAPFVTANELESLATAAFKALEGSNHEVRCALASMLGKLLATAHNPKIWTMNAKGKSQPSQSTPGTPGSAAGPRVLPAEECFSILATGFLRGATSFLKSASGGAGNVSREVRIGVAFAYLELVTCLGSGWLERNLALFVRSVLELATNFRSVAVLSAAAADAQLDCVYARRSIMFILRSTFGRLLSENAQLAACRELGQIIAEQINQVDYGQEPGLEKVISAELAAGQSVLNCALLEVSCLVQQLSTAATPLFVEASGIMEQIFASLLHPCQSTRVAAAWCLRAITAAVPSLITPLIDRCLSRLEHLKTVPEAISGYSFALAALLAGSKTCALGIPHMKGKAIFQVAEDLLRTAAQSSRLSLVKTQAGWLLLSAAMTMGSASVKNHLSRMMLLWRSAFPRTVKEAEGEKTRGDAFTWQVSLEARAGALSALHSFFVSCPELVTDDIVRRFVVPFEACLVGLSFGNQIVKQYGQQLRTVVGNARLRLFQTLAQLNPRHFEGCFAPLLRELVADLTLTDSFSTQTTSLLRQLCHCDDVVILGSCLYDTDYKAVEDQLEPIGVNGTGMVDHDIFVLCSEPSVDHVDPPFPLPVNVAILDATVSLFGKIFPRVATKHRVQMLDHFAECILQSKGPRQQSIQTNVMTALLSSFKALTEQKGSLESEPLRKSAVNLILSGLGNPSALVRCAAAEALGRLAQVVGDARFVAEMAQFSFDKLKTYRDAVNRTGYSLALGCLHRYVGGLGSGQHLNTSVSILLALAQDATSPIVQAWALHSLGLIAESGGPMFRGYVEPALGLSLKQLLVNPYSQADLHQAIGKLTSALITTVGPELQSNVGAIVTTRSSFFTACGLMTENPDPLVQVEAIGCLQQLHMFAPRHVNLSNLVPQLCRLLANSHLILRRAATGCLRQLAQREAREVHEHAQAFASSATMASGASGGGAGGEDAPKNVEEALFALLDKETDEELLKNARDTLTFLAQCLAVENLTTWLGLCMEILSPSSDKGSPSEVDKRAGGSKLIVQSEEQEEDSFHTGTIDPENLKQKLSPRWATRRFAMELVRKIIAYCDSERAHFDPILAKELQFSSAKGDYLVSHLSELVRMAFMASTSECTDLRLAGLSALQDVITKFCKVPEPDFPGHVILEQFQAQVGAALRPAFSPETPSNVTAAACQVCSTWIGSGVARDLNDLRRVHQLLVSSLAKLKKGSISTQLYSESAATLEKLAILKAWAEVYIVAMQEDVQRCIVASQRRQRKLSSRTESFSAATAAGHGGRRRVGSIAGGDSDSDDQDSEMETPAVESLLSLVLPELTALVGHWLLVLKDYALISLPTEFASQLPAEGGAFYTPETIDSVRPHYRHVWAPVLLASATWLRHNDFELPVSDNESVNSCFSQSLCKAQLDKPMSKNERLHLIIGICMETLCSPRSLEPLETVNMCLIALRRVFENDFAKSQLMTDPKIGVEILNVMHRLILTRESLHTQSLCLDVVSGVVSAAEEEMAASASAKDALEESNEEPSDPKTSNSNVIPSHSNERSELKNGRHPAENGGTLAVDRELVPCDSMIYATVEVCLCALVRQIPHVNPAVVQSKSSLFHKRHGNSLSAEANDVVCRCTQILSRVPLLCSKQEFLAILPTLLFLFVGIIRETSRPLCPPGSAFISSGAVSSAATAALQAIRSLLAKPFQQQTDSESANREGIDIEWLRIMRAAALSTLELEEDVDPVTLLVSIALFIVAAPRQVCSVAVIHSATLKFFEKSLRSPSLMVQQKCLQTLQPIFAHKDPCVAVPYIKALSPPIIAKLQRLLDSRSSNEEKALESQIRERVPGEASVDVLNKEFDEVTEENLMLLIEAEKCLEVLIAAAAEERRLPLIQLAIRMYLGIAELHCDSNTESSSANSGDVISSSVLAHQQRCLGPLKTLQEHSLQRLTKVGVSYPAQFNAALRADRPLRNRLEAALKKSTGASEESKVRFAATAATSERNAQAQQPSIKLTMDFSGFANKAKS